MAGRALKTIILALTLVPAVAAMPAYAQFSDSYNFLKAVRDADGTKATDIISKPGSVIIDTRERETGEGALHIVTKRRDLAWLNFLLSRGARVDLRDGEGNTALMIATQLRFAGGVELLLARRATVDLANNSGETPLIRAVQLRDAGLVRALLSAGANPDKVDSIAGMSARDYAKRDIRSAAIARIFEEPRAKPAVVAGPK